jgi:hypothetical protein
MGLLDEESGACTRLSANVQLLEDAAQRPLLDRFASVLRDCRHASCYWIPHDEVAAFAVILFNAESLQPPHNFRPG